MRIAFQGERGAFGELAAVEYFGSKVSAMPQAEFADVFQAVEKGAAAYGVIPIENSLAGSIHQNYDLFLDSRLFIVGEVYLRVSHYLIANRGVPRRNIKQIFSHPQALAQCKKYLKRFPNLKITAVSNTAIGVKMIRDNAMRDAAAIASMQAMIDYNMKCLAKNIEDNPNNLTRFLILAKKKARVVGRRRPMKTSIVFSTRNIPGALFKALSVFALRDINLFKIESRPVHSKAFEYLFYLDLEGNDDDEAQRNAINHLQEITAFYRMLGSYPIGRLAHPEYRKRL
jgi:prephenate dehydratase